MTNASSISSASEPSPIQQQADRSFRNFFFRAPGTYTLLGITVFVFFLQVTYGPDFVQLLLKNNAALRAGEDWRFLSPIFLHANEIHILLNMYALFQIGPIVEGTMGRFRFLSIYFLSGIAGVVLSLAFTTADSLGASGAIFGLIGAWGIYLFRHRTLLGAAGRNALSNIILIIVLNIGISFIPGIDLWAHFGGLITGALIAWLAGPVYQAQVDPTTGVTRIVSTQSIAQARNMVFAVSGMVLFAALAALRWGV
jgi:membrane associated rhomboid family serine protease